MHYYIRSFIFIVFVLLIFLITNFNFLKKKEREKNAEVLVVEGWLPDYALKQAIQEYNSHNYEFLVTSGVEIPPEYFMPEDGNTLMLDYRAVRDKSNEKYITSVSVRLSGTKADHQYAHFSVFVNNIKIGNAYSHRKLKQYNFHLKIRRDTVNRIFVVFDNDKYSSFRDRNLSVNAILVNKRIFPARSKYTFFRERPDEKGKFFRTDFYSYATLCANRLRILGFRDSIYPTPAIAYNKNRTYNSAQAVKKWYNNHFCHSVPINIITLDIHSRRTWLTYKSVFGKNTKIGIIPVPEKTEQKTDWIYHLRHFKSKLNESLSLIYVRYIFIPLKKMENAI